MNILKKIMLFIVTIQLSFAVSVQSLTVGHAADLQEGILEKYRDENTGFYGLRNKSGDNVLQPIYSSIAPFSDGMALVSIQDGSKRKYGYVDMSGKIVIEPKYYKADSFSEGLAAVEIDSKTYYIDKNGTVVIDNGGDGFIFGAPFSEGLAVVCVPYPDDLQINRATYLGCEGCINKNGEFVIEPMDRVISSFIGGIASVYELEYDYEERGYFRKSYYILKNGDRLSDNIFKSCSDFHNGYGIAEINDGQYVYVNTSGEIASDLVFEACKPFENGYANVKYDGKWCFIDSEFHIIDDQRAAKLKDKSNVEIGDYVLLGRYNNHPILWRCIDIDENGVLMLSDEVLCDKCFDEDGENEIGSHGVPSINQPLKKHRLSSWLTRYYRKHSGSNYWKDSNIRCWLNSDEPEGMVFWKCGNPPKDYSEEAGFLSDRNFSIDEKGLVKSVVQKNLLDPMDAFKSQDGDVVAWDGLSDFTYDYWYGCCEKLTHEKKNIYDKVSCEYVEDRVFLLDMPQYVKILENKHILGEYTKVDQEESRKTKTYWLRTPYGYERQYIFDDQDNSDRVFVVPKINEILADKNYIGVRPAFYLDDNAMILSGDGTKECPYSFSPHVNINGDALSFDVSPQIEDERVLVPMRAIFEALGATVEWDGYYKHITAEKDGHEIKLQIGMNEMYIDGEMIWLDVPPQIKSDRTLVPVRAVSEAFGATVEWEDATSTVKITIE